MYIQTKTHDPYGACHKCDLFHKKGCSEWQCVNEIGLFDVWKKEKKKPKRREGLKKAATMIAILLLFAGVIAGIIALPYVDTLGGKGAAICFSLFNLIAIVIISNWREGRKW